MNERRKKKQEEESRIIAELEEAMSENAKMQEVTSDETEQNVEMPQPQKCTNKKVHRSNYGDYMPEKIHCRQCRTLLENGVCPNCGYKIYVPMDEKKREKIKLILAGIFITLFVIIYVAIQISKG